MENFGRKRLRYLRFLPSAYPVRLTGRKQRFSPQTSLIKTLLIQNSLAKIPSPKLENFGRKRWRDPRLPFSVGRGLAPAA
jgi:hypothetical protein